MTSPAQVSGPGALSQRTDTGGQPIRNLPDPQYGEATAYREQQKGAPLAAQGPTPTPSAPSGGPGLDPMAEPAPPTPLFAPTQRPDEPVTAGAPLGPGPNTLAPGPTPTRAYPISSQISEYAAGNEALAWLANTLASQGQ